MSNDTISHVEPEECHMNGDEKVLSKSEFHGNDQLPSPKSNDVLSDHSDSQPSSGQRRRHQRGGRKKKSTIKIEDEHMLEQALRSTDTHCANDVTNDAETKKPKSGSTPLESNTFPGDYSDAASVDSQHSRPRRRHQRGGRKVKDSGKLRPDFESASGGSRPDEQEALANPETQDWSDDEDYDAEKLRKARASRPSRSKKQAPKSDTGIRSFNLKRADESGGRPIGVSVERPESRSKANKKKGKGKKKEKRSEESDEEEEKKSGPSIRLDLNLELEIFLKAKIKGDITISFL